MKQIYVGNKIKVTNTLFNEKCTLCEKELKFGSYVYVISYNNYPRNGGSYLCSSYLCSKDCSNFFIIQNL